MRVNAEPLYPLLLVDPKGWLGWCAGSENSRFSLIGALNTKRWVGFDASGAKWRVAADSFGYLDTWWMRLLANTVYNPRFRAEIRWAAAGQYTFTELQEQLCLLVDHGDDILTQFSEAEQIKKGIRECKGFDELTAKLRKMRVLRK